MQVLTLNIFDIFSGASIVDFGHTFVCWMVFAGLYVKSFD